MSLIEAVFFAQFDNHAGPIIRAQVPERFLSAERFESISDYIITKHLLANKLTTVHAFGKTVLGFPVCIEDPKYARNALNFNLGFVVPPHIAQHSLLLSAVSEVLRKIGTQLRALEIEIGFITTATLHYSSSTSLTSSQPSLSSVSTPFISSSINSPINPSATHSTPHGASTNNLLASISMSHLQSSGHPSSIFQTGSTGGGGSGALTSSYTLLPSPSPSAAPSPASSAPSSPTRPSAPPSSRGLLLGLLTTLFHDLNAKREALFPIDPSHSLRVQILPQPCFDAVRPHHATTPTNSTNSSSLSSSTAPLPPDPLSSPSSSSPTTASCASVSPNSREAPVLRDCDVPVVVDSADCLGRLLTEESCDLTIKRVLPFVDGVHHVFRIHRLSGVDLDQVKTALLALASFDAIRFVDIFAFSNIYVPAAGLRHFFRLPTANRDLALHYVLDSSSTSSAPISASFPANPSPNLQPAPHLSFKKLFSLYCAFDGSMTVAQVMAATRMAQAGVNPRKLVTFGLLNNLLHRVAPLLLPIGIPDAMLLESAPLEHLPLIQTILESPEPTLFDLVAVHHGKRLCEEVIAAYPRLFCRVFSITCCSE